MCMLLFMFMCVYVLSVKIHWCDFKSQEWFYIQNGSQLKRLWTFMNSNLTNKDRMLHTDILVGIVWFKSIVCGTFEWWNQMRDKWIWSVAFFIPFIKIKLNVFFQDVFFFSLYQIVLKFSKYNRKKKMKANRMFLTHFAWYDDRGKQLCARSTRVWIFRIKVLVSARMLFVASSKAYIDQKVLKT